MKLISLIGFLWFQVTFLNAETFNKKVESKNLSQLKQLKSEVYKNLTDNILPYWINNMMDTVNGGFYGKIDYKERTYPNDDKGGILNARILWTFSSAYRVTKDTSYLTMAKRARDYILDFFIDKI